MSRTLSEISADSKSLSVGKTQEVQDSKQVKTQEVFQVQLQDVKDVKIDVKSEVKPLSLILLLGRDLSLEEQKLLSLAGMMLFKFDSQIHGKVSLQEILSKFDGVVVNLCDENSITWYSEHKHQIINCKVVYIAKQGSAIVDKIPGLKQTLSANVVLKYLPQTAADKKDLIDKLHDHISRAGTKSNWEEFLKKAASLLKCLLL